MDTNLRAIRQTLGDACASEGYTVYDLMPSDPELPCVVIPWPDQISYMHDARGGCEIAFTLLVAAPDLDFQEAQERIDDVLSVPGLPSQIYGYRPEVAVWRGLSVNSATNIRREQAQNNRTYLIADIQITIIT